MTTKFLLTASAIVMATAFVHCASRDVPLGTEDEDAGDGGDASKPGPLEPDADVDAGPSDAGNDAEGPDGGVICDASPCVVALSGGYGEASGSAAFCGLIDDGTVRCWGSNGVKRLGYELQDGGTVSTAPRPVENLSNVTHISVGGDNACARVADGRVYCWGAPGVINAGLPADAGSAADEGALPTELSLVSGAATVGVGQSNAACITTSSGTLSCWGQNERFELARSPSSSYAPPGAVPLGGRAAAFVGPAEGRGFTITKAGELLSWGSTICPSTSPAFPCTHRLGRDTSEEVDPIPKLVPDLAGVRAVSSSTTHSCAIAGNEVVCWGGNQNGELGRGTAGLSFLPGATMLGDVVADAKEDAGVPAGGDVPIHISASEFTTCAVMASGRVYCWGLLGRNSWAFDDPNTLGVPMRVSGLSGPAVAVASSLATTCALLRSGVVECWGSNLMGLLGRGTEEGIDDLITLKDPAPVVFPGN